MDERVRSQVFGEDAATYDDARPSYPDAVIDIVVADAPRHRHRCRLRHREGGAAGGRPRRRRARHRTRRAHGRGGTPTRHSGDRQPVRGLAGATSYLVFSAQAWHWIDSAGGPPRPLRSSRLGAAGRRSGTGRPTSSSTTLTRAYARLAPALLEARSPSGFEHGVTTPWPGSTHGGFEPLERHQIAWTTIDVATLVARLSTSSSHRLLDRDVAAPSTTPSPTTSTASATA